MLDLCLFLRATTIWCCRARTRLLLGRLAPGASGSVHECFEEWGVTASTVDDADPAVVWRELYSSLPETSAALDAKVELRTPAPSDSAREYFQVWGVLPSSTAVAASSDLDTIEPIHLPDKSVAVV